MNDRARLLTELSADRDALLAVASRIDDAALNLPTRNDGWSVRATLAHVLACDADLISLLEAAAGPSPHPASHTAVDQQQNVDETARGKDAMPDAIVAQFRERAARWRALLDSLPDGALDQPACIWWRDAPAPLRKVLDDWRGHDAQHGEDVRLALDGIT